MAWRPTWQGSPRLSPASRPVALYTTTAPGGEVHFNIFFRTHKLGALDLSQPKDHPQPVADVSRLNTLWERS